MFLHLSSIAMIRFGPAGLGGVNEAIENLRNFHKLGLRACEIAFTYGIYIKDNQTQAIRREAEKLDVRLSIHAPYWINLNSVEKKKIEQSKERIIDCCKIGEKLGAYLVVFHPGYYGKMEKNETFENIKNAVGEIIAGIDKEDINIAAETTGKKNVFGSVDEINRLVRETGCSFCIDFAHLLARSNGKLTYGEMIKDFEGYKKMHCHFSGIEYNSSGERRHVLTPANEMKKLLEVLPKNKEIVVINESPSPIEDSVNMLKVLEEQRQCNSQKSTY